MGLFEFQTSPLGKRIDDLVTNRRIIARMEELSQLGQPAVGAIDEQLAGSVSLGNTERQYVGRWVKEVMTARGWRTTSQRRLAGGRVLSSGMHYERRPFEMKARVADVAVALLPADDRIARAQEIIRGSGITDLTVRGYLAEKREEARAEDARTAPAAR